MRTERPDLGGDALYEAVIARRLRIDAPAARTIMRRVEDSNQDWQSDRKPTFIDVVKYMIVSEYLARHSRPAGATVDGMALDLGAFLVERIDPRI